MIVLFIISLLSFSVGAVEVGAIEKDYNLLVKVAPLVADSGCGAAVDLLKKELTVRSQYLSIVKGGKDKYSTPLDLQVATTQPYILLQEENLSCLLYWEANIKAIWSTGRSMVALGSQKFPGIHNALQRHLTAMEDAEGLRCISVSVALSQQPQVSLSIFHKICESLTTSSEVSLVKEVLSQNMRGGFSWLTSLFELHMNEFVNEVRILNSMLTDTPTVLPQDHEIYVLLQKVRAWNDGDLTIQERFISPLQGREKRVAISQDQLLNFVEMLHMYCKESKLSKYIKVMPFLLDYLADPHYTFLADWHVLFKDVGPLVRNLNVPQEERSAFLLWMSMKALGALQKSDPSWQAFWDYFPLLADLEITVDECVDHCAQAQQILASLEDSKAAQCALTRYKELLFTSWEPDNLLDALNLYEKLQLNSTEANEMLLQKCRRLTEELDSDDYEGYKDLADTIAAIERVAACGCYAQGALLMDYVQQAVSVLPQPTDLESFFELLQAIVNMKDRTQAKNALDSLFAKIHLNDPLKSSCCESLEKLSCSLESIDLIRFALGKVRNAGRGEVGVDNFASSAEGWVYIPEGRQDCA